MLLRKWNYNLDEYEPYNVPDEWHCRYFNMDMTDIINCCQCGKEVKFGKCYSSHEVHTSTGFGYAVCEECHEVEIIRERRGKQNVRRFDKQEEII